MKFIHGDAQRHIPARLDHTTAMGIRWDLVVIGGGNAGLVAALSARHLVSRVLLLERSPIELRGGNTRHARNIRCVHRNPGTYNTDSYLHHEFFRDLRQAGDGSGNEALAALTISESEKVPEWMSAHGIHWQPLIRSERQLGRTNRLLLGGGKALVNAYHGTLASMGIAVLYDALVEDLVIDRNVCTGVVFSVAGIEYNVDTAAVICASGGFEGNDDWLSNYWGDAVANCTIRGSESNDGIVLNTLYAHGAASVGDERCFHAVPVDARSPRFDGGIATRLDTIPFGILVNQAGQRFCDEGDVLPKRYAIWGRRIADQPGQITYSIWDAKVNSLFRPPMYGPFEATSLADLARSLGLNELTLCETVAQYNSSPRSRARFDPIRFDGLATTGLDIPKSNWAQPIDEPPFYGVAMRPGITFISKGVAITEEAKVVRIDGSVFSNIFAAGAIMSGNILPTGFLSGFGLTVGSVWGHIAGTVAAHVET